MAAKKKTAGKKASSKASARPAKKAGKKAGAKSKASSLAPKPIGTGKGASPADIGRDVVAMVNSGTRDPEIWAKHFSKNLTSIEGMGVGLAWHGLRAVKAKGEQWAADHIVHGGSANGPFVGATGFAIQFDMDVETKSTGQRQRMREVGVYTVKNGKVVQEEFMYGM